MNQQKDEETHEEKIGNEDLKDVTDDGANEEIKEKQEVTEP